MAQPIDSSTLRPRRRWYGVAVFIAVLFTAIGIGGFVVGIVTATKSIPDFEQTFTGNQVNQVQLDAGRSYAFYVPEGAGGWNTQFDERIQVKNPGATFSFTRDGQQWTHLRTLTVDTSGTYTIDSDATTFAIGEEPEIGQFAGGLGGGIAALVGLPCFGIVVGGIIALVTGLRRSSHKRRLMTNPYA
ncbi:hypothetical protein [Cryptosporangium aurantiacum]|uniref:Uncharacterized protein n=1 Tax=Cryptosporangium aurantiacum TaxID=134849 RepID=A0A1M7RD94_9ACTN|nr:hypothetical protein [Cryptosporangium aurantiacum]SHN44122.1 hypothetical protein SAMN05443668_11070 [Cryptosporangium aurantiacum]